MSTFGNQSNMNKPYMFKGEKSVMHRFVYLLSLFGDLSGFCVLHGLDFKCYIFSCHLLFHHHIITDLPEGLSDGEFQFFNPSAYGF
jgi:hypothetical protein